MARDGDSFTYDQANRLTSATIGGVTTTYAYDGDGKRISTTSGGTTASFSYDVAAGLPVLLDDGTRKYVWGATGLAYSVEGSGVKEVVTVSHTDGLGSVRALTDASGAVAKTYQSDEFGVPTAGGTQGVSSQPFGFTGEQRDKETGLIYLRARLYDAEVGRFLSRDALPGLQGVPLSLNGYSYAGNNPVTATDPSGLRTYFVGGIGGAGDPLHEPFINVLRASGIRDVRGPVPAYNLLGRGDDPLNLAVDIVAVAVRGAGGPLADPDARAFGARILKDLRGAPLAPGEQLNIIALSGGATTAFNAADWLTLSGVRLDHVVTLGGAVFRGPPLSVRKWTSIIGQFDPVPHLAGIRWHLFDANRLVVLPGVEHYPGYLAGRGYDLSIQAIFATGLK